jgi:hypothetical protein
VQKPLASLGDDIPLSGYGIDSVSSISLAFEIEERYGIELDTGILWEYRTVGLLVEMIWTLISESAEFAQYRYSQR